jgi:hypothetical protein
VEGASATAGAAMKRSELRTNNDVQATPRMSFSKNRSAKYLGIDHNTETVINHVLY